MGFKQGPEWAKVMVNIPVDTRTYVKQLAIELENEFGRSVPANDIYNALLNAGLDNIEAVKEKLSARYARNRNRAEKTPGTDSAASGTPVRNNGKPRRVPG